MQVDASNIADLERAVRAAARSLEMGSLNLSTPDAIIITAVNVIKMLSRDLPVPESSDSPPKASYNVDELSRFRK